MQISSSDLLNLPVYTQSNTYLGRLASFDVDIDSHAITSYHVKTGLIRGLWHEQLTIALSQVISISLEKMIVEDNVAKEAELEKVNLAAPVTR